MRVLILSHYFEPEPLPKPMDLAQGLVARGHSAVVITGFPNYPSGKIFPGYRVRLFSRETIRGIPVLRTAIFPSHGTSVLGRLANYGSFMISSVLGAFLTPKCEVMYVWHPPLTIGVSAWMIGWLKRIPFVYDVQDIWPESGVWSGMVKGGNAVRLMDLLARWIYRKAAHLLVVTEGAKKNLIAKGVPERKLSIASHWIDEDLFRKADPKRAASIAERFHFAGRFVVMFTGNMGLVQGLDAAVAAAETIEPECPDVLFVFMGGGTDLARIKKSAETKKLGNVVFIEPQPMEAVPHFTANADALLLILKDSEVNDLVIPVKTFAYLAAGRPILAALRGAGADLVQRAGAGIVVDPNDAAAFAEGVKKLRAMTRDERGAMGERGREYLSSHHAKERVIDDYVERLEKTAGRNRDGTD